MSSSILTNNSAMVALKTLTSINKDLAMTQNEISTGKRVASSADNSAVWAISKAMESDVNGFKAISDSLALGESTVALARNASETITDLLTDMKGRIVAAQEENVDRNAIQADIDALEAQIGSVVSAAQFNGLNLIDGSSTNSMDVLSSLNRDASGNVTAANISVTRQNLSVTSSATTATAGALVGSATAFTVLNGATVAAGADTTGTGYTTLITAGVDATDTGTNTPAAMANGTSASFTVAEVESGATYQIFLEDVEVNVVGGGTTPADRLFEYVASETDSAADIASNLANQINAFLGAATNGGSSATINATTNTAGNVTQNEIILTNSTGAAFNFTAAMQTGGTAGTSATTGGLGALATIDVTSGVGATGALAAIDGLINQAIDASAAFGSVEGRIQTQSEFVTNLTDSLRTGIGSLVDADMQEASARLQALQTQQQLGIQALSIANQQPQSILQLFR